MPESVSFLLMCVIVFDCEVYMYVPVVRYILNIAVSLELVTSI